MSVRVFLWPPNGLEIPMTYVGVVLERLNDGDLHAGVLYRVPGRPAYTLHHLGHYGQRMCHQPPQDGQLCILCAVDPLRIPTIGTAFLRLWRQNNNPGLPYGFSTSSLRWFTADGTLELRQNGIGLCCQTFVQAAFAYAGLILLDPSEPLPRPDDLDRQRNLINKWQQDIAASSQNTRDHFAAVLRSCGVPLFRPREVAGAALCDFHPTDRSLAFKMAEIIKLIF